MNLNKPTLIISNDAGGATIINAWLKKNILTNVEFCLAGPAVDIFKTPFISEQQASSNILNQKYEWILTGTSWENLLELRLIKQALECEIKISTYLDHWINHRERFGYPQNNWEKNLPHEIWCGDKHCLQICQDLGFPTDKLKLVENEYFKETKLKCLELNITPKKKSLLYLTEPIAEHMQLSHRNELYLGYNEYTCIEDFIRYLPNVAEKIEHITIRPHPSEPTQKYLKYQDQFPPNIEIQISKQNDLLKELLQHEMILGCETMAMVIALLANKEVYTMIPLNGRPCVLPFEEIKPFFTLLPEECR